MLKKETREAIIGYSFLMPVLLILILFTFGPMIFGLYTSFHEWNMLTPISEMPFVGLDNYNYYLFKDALFWTVLGKTLLFVFYVVSAITLSSLVLALAVNSIPKFTSIARTILFLPVITSLVVECMIWRNMLYQPTWGLINSALMAIGLPTSSWLYDPAMSLLSIAIVVIWKWVGMNMVIFLAGLQEIPETLYEAAKIDGANSWWRFRSVTLPSLKRVFAFVVVNNIIGGFMQFTPVWLLTQGGPGYSSTTYPVYIYDTCFSFLKAARATALSYILFIIIFALSFMQLIIFRERGARS